MLRYILKRIVLFVPTLFAISLITFVISLSAPGDPAEQMVQQSSENLSDPQFDGDKAYKELRKKMGLDLPAFYLSISQLSYPDTFYRIPYKWQRRVLGQLIDSYGNWPQIEAYHLSIDNLERVLLKQERDNEIIKMELALFALRRAATEEDIRIALGRMGDARVSEEIVAVDAHFAAVKEQATSWKNYVPAMNWHGASNQYHYWITNLFKGNLGTSLATGLPIETTLWSRLKWTFLITLISVIFTFLIAIPLGIRAAVNRGKWQDRIAMISLFLLYSLPSFWIASLLLMFFACGDYFCLFPAYGLGEPNFLSRAWHLALPVFCFVYPSVAFVARQMRGGMVSQLQQDYIRTAKAKGLGEEKLVWKHAFRNSLLPIITIIASVFPLMVGGSVVIEVIFNIPGMGLMGYEAVISRDYPVVYTIMMFGAGMTLLGYMVSDILYAIADPRITYAKKMT